MAMSEGSGDIGRFMGKYFTAELVEHRNVSPKTIDSYRDALKLLLMFFRDIEGIAPERLALSDIRKDTVMRFLSWLESARGCSIATRNQRLAVIRSFCRFAAVERPDCMGALTAVIEIREKKCAALDMNYLGAEEVRTLLAQPKVGTALGFRDTVLLSALYDTAARAQELCDVTIGDVRGTGPMVIILHGKGSKSRCVPVMDATARLIKEHMARQKEPCGLARQNEPLFKSSRGGKFTRWGIAKLLGKYVAQIRCSDPEFAHGLNVSPHTFRRSRAMHLIQADVNLIYIRDLLGHADVSTTEVYARADSEMKRKAIERAYESLSPDALPNWCDDSNLIGWLERLGR
jgi:site-specific recombinase XerD